MPGTVLICLILFISTTNAANAGFSFTLIHRDSPLSPFHNPNLTHHDLNQAKFDRSIARAHALSVALTPQLSPEQGEYLVRFVVGDIPFTVHAILDTGSSFIWFQCQPCQKCYPQKDPIYDPSKSYTSKSFDCTNSTCNFTPGHSCSANNECAYHLAYLDGSFSDGVLMQEEFVFEGPDSATVKGVKLAFGCGRNNVFKGFSTDGGNLAGVMGMGRGQLSLASQLAQPAFAYCLLGEADKSTMSRVQLGSRPRMWGNSTAIVRARGRESQYSVLLNGVSLGAMRVINIPTGQVVSLDSGASMTFLELSLFGPVIEAVRGAMKGFEVARDPRGLSELCYSATTKELVQAGLPVLELGFVGGSRLEVKAESLFLEVAERRVCITLIRSSFGQSIIGNIAQQNNVVGYDLANDRIYMSGAYDCKLY
ncbi:Aspartic proteinase CDR1 [Acorus gramineus]|uniref:Aspartic proteinase CDR1 n=1 Tax=Acorus gramineus TaxID=55184 RepID=A0AAV9BKP6_ACOGR|nr:Aspartic proteinase CDR1 [Acorus gramineus]